MPLVILAQILEVMMRSVGGVGPTISESNLHLGILATSGLRQFVRFCIILRQLWSNDVGGQPATSLATWNSGAESFNLLIAIYLGNFIGSTLAAYIVSEAKTFATSGLPDWCQNWYTGRQTTDYEWMGRRYHLRQSLAHDRRQKPRSRFNWMDYCTIIHFVSYNRTLKIKVQICFTLHNVQFVKYIFPRNRTTSDLS